MNIMKLAVVSESIAGEDRVATVPDAVRRLVTAGWEVYVQSGAGIHSQFTDAMYEQAGATVSPDVVATLSGADIVAKVRPPTPEEVSNIPEGASVVSFMQPAVDRDTIKVLMARKITAYSFDLLPRISRAQSMDALSSQATVSGYRAALVAATILPKFFPMFMTAAGTVPPAKVMVMGAGVAGLQAIATAKRLGAQVRAYDVRTAAKEEVESLGATFIQLELEAQEGAGGYAKEQSEEFLARQRELIGKEVAASDVVITTAAIPGRRAPLLVTREMVEMMSPGAVVVDMAADSGGNCEVTEPGKDVVLNGVTVRGLSNPPSSMPEHASFLFARNVASFLGLLVKDGEFAPDFDDEIVSGMCVTRDGLIPNDAVASVVNAE